MTDVALTFPYLVEIFYFTDGYVVNVKVEVGELSYEYSRNTSILNERVLE